MTWQKIQAEIAAHESTLEELKKSARFFPPASPECRSPRGGTQLDALQVKMRVALCEGLLDFNYTLLLSACKLLGAVSRTLEVIVYAFTCSH